MLNWRASVRKKEGRALHTIRAYILVLRRKWENMHTTTKHKLQLIASNQSTHNTLFYVHVLTIGNANSITRKEICYYQSSANVEDLMS